MPLVTRCATSRNLTASKHARLSEIARRCGNVRRETWARYGELGGLGRNNREIRDEDWMSSSSLGTETGLPARIWKATLEDSLNAITKNGNMDKKSTYSSTYAQALAAWKK